MKAEDLKQYDNCYAVLQLAEPALLCFRSKEGRAEPMSSPDQAALGRLIQEYEQKHGKPPPDEMVEAWAGRLQQPAFTPVMAGRLRVVGSTICCRYEHDGAPGGVEYLTDATNVLSVSVASNIAL